MLLCEDRQLLQDFREGRREALARVYDHYVEHLAAFLRGGFTFGSKGEQYSFRGCQSAADLQDTLQETFCRAFTEGARLAYDGLHPYGTYLLAIARNLTIDRFRRQVREVHEPVHGRPAGHEPDPGEAAPEDTPEAQVLAKEVAGIIRAFCDSLDEKHRAVLRVYFDGEEGQRQAAAALGMKRHQLRASINKMRRRLERQLAAGGYWEPAPERRARSLLLVVAMGLGVGSCSVALEWSPGDRLTPLGGGRLQSEERRGFAVRKHGPVTTRHWLERPP